MKLPTQKRMVDPVGLGDAKFFADKNLYARQFHSLQIRSKKQDLAFKRIIELMRAHQACIEESTRLMTNVSQKATQKTPIETQTSVDKGMIGIIRQWEERNDVVIESKSSVSKD